MSNELEERVLALESRVDTMVRINEELAQRNRELAEIIEELAERTAPATRSIKPKEPERFLGGKSDDWHAWVRSLRLYLRTARVVADDERIQTALAFFGGNASLTAQPYFEMLENDRELGTFEAFIASMTAVYGQIDREGAAKNAIEALKMTGTAAEYTAEFVRHAQLTRYSEYDKKERYLQGLNAGLLRSLLTSVSNIEANRDAKEYKGGDVSLTFDELIREAIRLDNVNERVKRYAPPRTTATAPRVAPKPTNRPNGSSTTEKDPNAMEVDPPATPAGPKCYNCNKYGHLSRNCTEPRRPRPVARIQRAGGEGDTLAKILEMLSGLTKKEVQPVVSKEEATEQARQDFF